MLLLLAVQVPTGWFIVGSIAFVLLASYMLGGLFGRTPNYRIAHPEQLPPNDSRNFFDLVESLTDAKINYTGCFEDFTNGPNFYPAELEAIRSARRSVNLEAYVFRKGRIAIRFRDALAERAAYNKSHKAFNEPCARL